MNIRIMKLSWAFLSSTPFVAKHYVSTRQSPNSVERESLLQRFLAICSLLYLWPHFALSYVIMSLCHSHLISPTQNATRYRPSPPLAHPLHRRQDKDCRDPTHEEHERHHLRPRCEPERADMGARRGRVEAGEVVRPFAGERK